VFWAALLLPPAGTWYQPSWGMQRYEDVYEEAPCAENNFGIGATECHVPEAKTPDF
jgi:hypothetical protein